MLIALMTYEVKSYIGNPMYLRTPLHNKGNGKPYQY